MLARVLLLTNENSFDLGCAGAGGEGGGGNHYMFMTVSNVFQLKILRDEMWLCHVHVS